MTIYGLENDGYVINNPILVSITDTRTDMFYVEVQVQNLTNLKTTSPFRLYFQNQVAKLNLTPIIKGLFDVPIHNTDYLTQTPLPMPRNSNSYRISFRIYYTNGDTSALESEIRQFIRAGYYDTRMTNETIGSDVLLQNSEKVPVFGGYPCAYYITSDKKEIVKYNRVTVHYNDPYWELMRKKTCDGVYIKFLNSKGGYSYWLFEDWKDTTSNSHLGYVSSYGGATDLGSDASFEFEVMSKVPRRYMGLMTDLILSPEVYLYLNNGSRDEKAWRRYFLKDNKIEEKRKSVAYNVNIKFTQDMNFNPSLVWSN